MSDIVTRPTDEEQWAADEEAHPAPLRSPTPPRDDEDNDCDDALSCSACGGVVGYLGPLGNYDWFSCRHCGKEHCERTKTSGGRPTNMNNELYMCSFTFRRKKGKPIKGAGQAWSYAWAQFVTSRLETHDWVARANAVEAQGRKVQVRIEWWVDREPLPISHPDFEHKRCLASRILGVLEAPYTLEDNVRCPVGTVSPTAWAHLRAVLQQLRAVDDRTRGYEMTSWHDLRPQAVDLWNDAEAALVLHELEI